MKCKKILSAALAAVLSLTLAACGSSGEENDADETVPDVTVTTAEAAEMRDISSSELVKEIKIGWSLGNTFDATGGSGVDSETSWGNPLTTKEVITAVKDAGFNIIRIPVTWGIHMDENNVVDSAWMDRVQEVVDYAYGQDMFVILNAHHEDWYDPYYANQEAACQKLTALWQQIGTRFADYGERLIFEGLNEPRMRNTAKEWNGGDQEGWDVVNAMNGAFVSAVRGLGGNNALRHLMIPAYAASSNVKTLKALTLLEGDDKIIVSVHAYLPYTFALSDDLAAREFTPGEGSASEILNLMDTLKTNFIDKGIPVIIGETGARSKANEDIRAQWATYYISQAKAIGVPCIWWDNGAFSGNGECFGLLDRSTCQWKFPAVVDGLMNGLE